MTRLGLLVTTPTKAETPTKVSKAGHGKKHKPSNQANPKMIQIKIQTKPPDHLKSTQLTKPQILFVNNTKTPIFAVPKMRGIINV